VNHQVGLLDTITIPAARSAIVWMIGEYRYVRAAVPIDSPNGSPHSQLSTSQLGIPPADVVGFGWLFAVCSEKIPKLAPDALRKLAKSFPTEVRFYHSFAF
jgi:hypothetical protein